MRTFSLTLLAVLAALASRDLAAQQAPRSLASLAPGCCTLRVRSGSDKAQGRLQALPAAGSLILLPCEGALCPRAGSMEHALTLPPGALVDMQAGRRPARVPCGEQHSVLSP